MTTTLETMIVFMRAMAIMEMKISGYKYNHDQESYGNESYYYESENGESRSYGEYNKDEEPFDGSCEVYGTCEESSPSHSKHVDDERYTTYSYAPCTIYRGSSGNHNLLRIPFPIFKGERNLRLTLIGNGNMMVFKDYNVREVK